MGGGCSTCGEKRGIYRGNLRERDHLEESRVDERIILNGPSGSRMWGHGLDGAGLG
jgi:hypothetical protein